MGKQIQENDKDKKELLDWFLAETDELADLVYDSSTNGKPSDTRYVYLFRKSAGRMAGTTEPVKSLILRVRM